MKRNFIINCATIIALGLVAAGCSNDNIDKGSNEMQEQAKSTFPVADIDPAQDWNTSATRSATVSIGGEPYNSYDIYLFTEMPTSGVATPTVATQKGVRGGRTLQFTFDIAKAQTELFVGRNGESGFVVKQVSLATDSTYTADFNLVADTKTRSFSDKKDEMSGNPFESVTAPYDSYFKTSVPSVDNSTVFSNINGYKSATNYTVVYTSGTYDNVELQGTPNAIYISGDVHFTGKTKLYTCGDCTLNIYILPNSKLTIDPATGNLQNSEMNFYVAETGGLVLNGSLTAPNGKTINVYNRGTLTMNATSGTISNGSMIYNEGTLNASSIDFNSGAAETFRGMLINKGKVVVTNNVTMTSNCSLLNDSYMSVGGSVTANQSSIWFVNTGNLTVTEDMVVRAGNNTFYNGCQIKVDGTLNLDKGSGDAAFNILSDGSFYCTNLVMGNNQINLGARSSVIVNGTTTFAQHGGYDYQGFDATGITSESDRAYVDLGTIQFTASTQALSNADDLQATGNMILTADNLQYALNLIPWQGVKAVKLGEGVVTTVPEAFDTQANLDEDASCLQNTPVPYTPPTTSTNYTYAFEDMMLGDNSDYDFNDVVLRVTTPDADGKVTVTLEAAGATRQIAVKHKSTDGTVRTLWEDVHTALGVNAGTMVNTGTGVTSDETPTVSDFYIGSITTNGDFYILVDGTTEVHIPQYTEGFQNGNVPYALQVTGTDWQWPTETTTITDAYSNFASWARNALENSDWYKTGTITNVYTKE